MCSNIYHLDHPVKVLSTPGLAWQAALKTIELRLKLLIACHAVDRYAKTNNLKYAIMS